MGLFLSRSAALGLILSYRRLLRGSPKSHIAALLRPPQAVWRRSKDAAD